jgi:hypothetical protein
MYKAVHRYLELETIVDSPDFLSRMLLLNDTIIQPLFHLAFWVCFWAFPEILPYFRYSETPSTLKLVMYITSSLQMVYSTIVKWSNIVEFYHLGTLFLVTHIQMCRRHNPFVIRSDTPSHQLFRYSSLLENLSDVPTKHSLK